jgi:molecular chaperone HscB
MNYFEFYEMPIAFSMDEKELKKCFLKKSKQFHPDFFTMESDEKQAEVLELSTFNTEAFKVLSDEDKRMYYVLTLKGAIAPEGQNQLPPDFLMEVMDINEQIMELEFDNNSENYEKVMAEINNFKNNLNYEIFIILQRFDFESVTNEDLDKIKIFYFKKKYLLRMSENVSKFAPH